jgi:dienelactone hydrolase
MQWIHSRGVLVIGGLLLMGPVADSGFAAAAGQSPGFVEEEVTFRNGDVTLAGTLTLPAGSGSRSEGPYPAIVYLHGSGPMSRGGAASYAERWAALGIAGLRYDKRGTGESAGSWTASSLTDLAADAVAALEYLAARPEIDPDRIGFWGVSQAGWVATEAVSLTERIAFLVVVSGGGVTPYASEVFSYRGAFERAGLSAEQTARGLAVVDQYMSFLATGEGRDELTATLEASRGEAWAGEAHLERIFPSTEAGRRAWRWVAAWDPAPLIAQMRFPVLVLFGGRDTEAPAEASIAAWRRGLEAAGNPDFAIRLFPEAGHGIRLWSSGHHGGGRPPFAEGYFETMDDWLLEHVVGRSAGPG